jgi:hypothetical protein
MPPPVQMRNSLLSCKRPSLPCRPHVKRTVAFPIGIRPADLSSVVPPACLPRCSPLLPPIPHPSDPCTLSLTPSSPACKPLSPRSSPRPHQQNFVVAGGSQNGTIAVITLPLSYVRGSPGRSTTLTLDAQNSSPKPGTTLTQWVWAVITIPDKTAVTNTTGRITQVRLRPGGSWWLALVRGTAGHPLLFHSMLYLPAAVAAPAAPTPLSTQPMSNPGRHALSLTMQTTVLISCCPP